MTESTALTIIERAQVALQPAANDKQLAELAAQSKSITSITNAAGREQCHSARMALKNQRVAIEKIAKSAREDATAFSKAVIAEEKRLIGIIQPEEQRLETLQDAWDAARAAEKKAREEVERVRVAEIQRRLVKLESLPEVYTSAMAPDRLMMIIQQLEEPAQFDYEEFTPRATELRQAALVAIRAAHVEALERIERENADRAAREAEEARKAAERQAEADRLAEVRRRLDEERAEQDRQAAVRRQEEERRQTEERARLEDERKEQERVAALRERLADLRAQATIPSDWTSAQISDQINLVNHIHTDDGSWFEFAKEAQEAQITGIRALAKLRDAAIAREAESSRLATERAELERRQREQAAQQAEIERRDREQRETAERQAREVAEAETRRIAAEQAEREQQEAEAARQRQAEAQRAQLRERISQLQAWEIADIVAQELGTDSATVAERIAEIAHDEWVALSMSVVGEEEAA